jgi:hypothetical protein
MALITCPECKKQISETVKSCPHCGYVFTDGETTTIKKNESNVKIVFFIILIVGIFVLFKVCTGGNNRTGDSVVNTPWDEKDNTVGAWVYTKMYVEQNLKSPRTAKFPWDFTKHVQRDGTTYMISSYVDSQNAFGAMIRTHFNATVKEVSEDRWVLISFEFK